MTRTLSVFVLSATFAMGAAAQTSTSPAKPSPGDYAGSLQEEGGSRASDVKLNIKHITADGRVTARVQGAHPNKACGASLPASGTVQKDGTMRLEVDAGAPEGCERIYMIKSASGGSVSGTFIDATRTGGKLIPRKPSK